MGDGANTRPNQQPVHDEDAFIFGQMAAGYGRRYRHTGSRVQPLLYQTLNLAASKRPARLFSTKPFGPIFRLRRVELST